MIHLFILLFKVVRVNTTKIPSQSENEVYGTVSVILHFPIVCFKPRNESCNFKLEPEEGGGSRGNYFSSLCSDTDIPPLSLSVYSQQRELHASLFVLASFLLAEARSFPGLHTASLVISAAFSGTIWLSCSLRTEHGWVPRVSVSLAPHLRRSLAEL